MRALDFAVSLAIGVLTGLGVGSGGLLLVYLVALGAAQQQAQGINLAFFIFASLASLVVNLKKRRIKLTLLMYVLFFGIVGVALGTFILPLVPQELLRSAFGVILIAMSLITFFEERIKNFFKKRKKDKNEK